MRQLLIVEDEKWEREGLRDFLDWESMGVRVAACARDGEEGVALAEARRPDIIIADIRMPKMDGLRMAKLVRSFLPDAKIIILTGYDDFQYARQALGLRACAYILKPVERAALEEAVREALSSLERERKRDLETAALRTRWAEYADSRKDHALFDALEHGAGLGALRGSLRSADAEIRDGSAITVASLYSLAEPGGMPVPLPLEGGAETLRAVKARIERRGELASFGDHGCEAVLLLGPRASPSGHEEELQSIALELEAELGVGLIAGIGEPFSGESGVAQSYMQARIASSYRFIRSCGEATSFGALSSAGSAAWDEARALILAADEAVGSAARRTGAKAGAELRPLVDGFLSRLRANPAMSKMLVGYFLLEAGVSAEDADIGKLHCLEQTRRRLYSAVEARAEARGATGAEGAADRGNAKEEEIVRGILRAIEERYSEDLDLAALAAEAGLSPYYLGSIFRKRAGKSFSRYLAEHRLEAAGRILREGPVKLSELSAAVGISSPSYFCALFKRRYGVSPVEFRRIGQGRA